MRSKWILVIFALFTGAILSFDQLNQHPDRAIAVQMFDVNGNNVGVIVAQPVPNDRVLVTVNLRGLSEGFHGFHIHETGLCDADTGFASANNHFDLANNHHGQHSGDLPILEADATGYVYLAVYTARFKFDDLSDRDGSAFIVHADADNVAHIPARYGGADATTLANGDAGQRIACGVIAAPQ